MQPTIRVYFDLGANPSFSAECALRQLKAASLRVDPSIAVQPITPETIRADDSWHRDTLLLCMPGGASTPMAEKLNGAGNASIRRYVENGGAYFGICAGAYYAASRVSFRYAGTPPLEKEHELGLLPAHCDGPIAEFGVREFDATGTRCLRSVEITCVSTGARYREPYWGGPRFIVDESNPNLTVLYRYSQLPDHNAAVISMAIGKGRALLSSVHPEVTLQTALQNAREQLPGPEFDAAAINQLFSSDAPRAPLLSTIIHECYNRMNSNVSRPVRRSILRHHSAAVSGLALGLGTGLIL
jgi:glutamine amidotransferase-like uncharacterized protein